MCVPASDRIDELKKRYDENPRRFFASLANEYRKAGDLEQAITICQAHLAEQPSNMNGHVVYGQALFEAGRYDEAKTTFESALTLDPENLIALRHLGDIACTNGENKSARTWYERVLDADPRNEEIIALLAHLDADHTAGGNGSQIEPSIAPEARASGAFTAPQAVTPPTTRPAADPTPVVPLDAVKTLQMPAAPPRLVPPRESIGLMDLSIDFEGTAEAGQPAPASPAFDDIGTGFPAFEDVEVPAAPYAAPAPTDAAGDFLVDPFSDSFAGPLTPAPAEAPELAEGTQPEPPAAPFVTETMAELYLQQGFTAEALEVYRQLSAESPGDESLRERVRKLERGDRTSLPLDIIPDDAAAGAIESGDGIVHDLMPERAPVVEREEPAEPAARGPLATVRSYFAGLAARRAVQGTRRARTAPRVSSPRAAVAAPAPAPSLDELFSGSAIAPGDEDAALAFAQVAGAVEMGSASVQGKPTAPASSELSLDSVFRESEPRATAPVARQSQTLRFDQFFAAAGDEGDAPAPATGSAPVGEPGSPAELQQFQSWLTQLKKP